MITRRETCRVCDAPMKDQLSLGDIVPVDFITDAQTVRETAPLTLCECERCGLVQLRDVVQRDTLFRQYWYLSGLNPSMVDSLHDVVACVRARVTLEEGDVVVDIGANDGTLLDLYDKSLTKVAFEPARNLIESLITSCDVLANDYFETSDCGVLQAKVITSIAMFYDLDDPRAFVRRIADWLLPDGIWVMQMTDLVCMLRTCAFDNICHEHLVYYSLAIFRDLVAEYGLEVFDVSFNDVNGASVRAYVGWKGARDVQSSVTDALLAEQQFLDGGDAIARFSARVMATKRKVVDFIREKRSMGKIVHALGASTKGNTLLQFFGLTNQDVVAAAEVNPDKYGMRMAGSDVPIIPQEESLARRPDYYLVLPWHFLDFFLRKHHDYLAAGGQIIAPLPDPQIYTATTRRML